MQDQDAASLNRMLLSRMEELCQFLLPNGKPKGLHWMVGGLTGESGESLQITMSGSAAGRFIDFANKDNKGASPLWLWAKVKGLNYPEAIKQAKDWLGVRDDDLGVKRHKQKTYSMPEKAGIRSTEPNTPVMDYLTIERRLDPIIVANAKICETPDGEAMCFPFFDWDAETGKWLNCHRKYLKLARPDGKKDSWATKGTKRCLYGKNLVDDNASEIVICEGEIDAMSWQSWGIPAVSVPNGVSDFEWVDIDWEWLTRFEKIYVSMDMDEPGKTCSLDIAKRLGIHRCYIVSLPNKDANECLQDKISRDGMLECLASSKALELDEIKRPDDFKSEVMEYYTSDPSSRGVETPWTPTIPWRIRKGEMTILSGFSGHGKALSLDTPIPTPTGWKTMGELFPGDQVFDQDGMPCNVVFATPIQLDRKCFEVLFSDGSTIIADADHLWETWSPHARNSLARQIKTNATRGAGNGQRHKCIQPEIHSTSEIASSIYESRWVNAKHLKHAVPVAGALELKEIPLPLEPYCLGAWLGDGTSAAGGITCGHGDENILRGFEQAGFVVNKHNLKDHTKTPQYGIHGLMTKLREAGVLGNKHIPSPYLRASASQRMALLQGLMDTDGCITQYGRCEFTSMVEILARGVLELVRTLGMRPTLTTGEASVNGKKCGTKYRVFFTPSETVFRLARKSARVNYGNASRRNYRYIVKAREVLSVPVKCIQVDSPRHLYLCGEAMIPTHNTAGLNQLMLHCVSKGLKVMDASLEIKPAMTLYNMTRCALGKKYSERPDVEACIGWLNESVFFLDCIGTVNVTRIMHAMEYARKRHGIDVFVIDSLFKCGLSGEDYAGARDFADKLTTFCNNTGAHVILVAHSRKTNNGNEMQAPTKSDVAGSSDLTNAAFNVVIFWRNKNKKRQLDQLRASPVTNYEELAKWQDQPDGKIILDKQRFGEGEECEAAVWFCKESCQFGVTPNAKAPYFVVKT